MCSDPDCRLGDTACPDEFPRPVLPYQGPGTVPPEHYDPTHPDYDPARDIWQDRDDPAPEEDGVEYVVVIRREAAEALIALWKAWNDSAIFGDEDDRFTMSIPREDVTAIDNAFEAADPFIDEIKAALE